MLSDNGRLLRSLLFAQTEAARLGHLDASKHLESAAQCVASSLNENRRVTLSDDIFEIIEKMNKSQQDAEDN